MIDITPITCNDYPQLAEMVGELLTDLYGHLKAKELSNDYMVAFIGAVAMAEIYHDIWPVEHAIQSVRRAIGK